MSSEMIERLSTALSDRYRIERELGSGGMATVYLAHDLRHGRDVAVKVLHASGAASTRRRRFLDEIRLAAGLNHPHILPLFDSGEAGDALFFVMPVMRGQTLRERLQAAPLSVDEAVRIGIEVADALDYAHRRQVVHRDIKPENILLHEGHAAVADFGIGKAALAAVGESESITLTGAGLIVGTPAYMSPEQAVGDEIDGRSDLFALGCVLYEMLTGETAFTGATAQAVIARRLTHAPDRVDAARTDVPPPLGEVVARLLQPTAADRYATGAEVVSALRSVAGSGSGQVAIGSSSAAGTAVKKSIAVLPFVNMSADPDNEFFSDGLTEELITDLSRIRALRVISRTSSMQQKNSARGLRAIGRDLGVSHLLTGSVRKAGTALRITAQLIDARTDAQLWAEKYSGTIEDVFDVQERVSRAIVDALDLTLRPEESHRLRDRPIANVRAFELYLQARQELREYNVDRALPLIERALSIEGEVPALRALRAMAAIARVRAGLHTDTAQLAAAEAEARALIRLEPDSAYGHTLLGYICYETGALGEGVRALRRALELDPADQDILFHLGISLQAAGQSAETFELGQRMLSNDPLSPMAGALAGSASWFVGRAAEGVKWMELGLELAPDSLVHHWALGYHYCLVGRVDESEAHVWWMRNRLPSAVYTVQLHALTAALKGRHDEARAILEPLDLDVLDGHQLFHVSESITMAGDTARGMAALEHAIDRSFCPYDFIAVHCPFLQPLRGRPDFARLLSKAARRVAEFQEGD
jgi:serine/threonine protein kinase